MVFDNQEWRLAQNNLARNCFPRLHSELLQTFLGRTQLRHSASQRHVFACGSMVLADRLVCGFSARSAENPHTIEKESTAWKEDERIQLADARIQHLTHLARECGWRKRFLQEDNTRI